jgi:hypothetical protein
MRRQGVLVVSVVLFVDEARADDELAVEILDVIDDNGLLAFLLQEQRSIICEIDALCLHVGDVCFDSFNRVASLKV